ncbi:MAG: DUF177 domain-containing protein [Bacteroidota bacterium]
MNVLNGFNIDIYKLADGRHNYQFEIGNSFFEAIDDSLIDKGLGAVNVELNKNDSFIKLNFKIEVSVELVCDRSLDLFTFPINTDQQMIFKYGDEEQEIDDEVVVITRGKQRINVAQYIYEFIGIEIPMKKLHPRYEEGDAEDELVYSSKVPEKDSEEKQSIDPRWDKLKGLK